MKKIYSWVIILTFFISCTSDSTLTSSDTIPNAITTMPLHQENRTGDAIPFNTDNIYDVAGKIHNELFESYYGYGTLPTTVAGIAVRVDSIASFNSNFIRIKRINYIPVSIGRVDYLLTNKTTCVSTVIAGSNLSVKGKLSLENFINSLLLLFDGASSCTTLYDFIVDYETSVISDPLLTVKDKKIILITTSISRHSTYMAKKRPKKNTDPDWTVLICNIAGGTDRADFGIDEALMQAFIAGVAQN